MAIEQNLADILAARYGRDVRQSIHDGIAECYSDVSEAETMADAAALNANQKADLANTAAQTANQKADLANTAAQTANTAATNADQKADLANTAAQNADSKAALANAATEAANTAATNADQKAAMANAATEAANTATNNANVATTNAQAATETANTAATNADQKASLANTAATNADQKAELANTAAGSANTAASSANTAAQTANAAADTAEAKAILANNAAQYASGFTQPYIHIKYSAVQPTSNADMVDVPSDWIGLYSGNSATAPVNYTDYRWFRYKGEPGDVGNHNHDTLYLGIDAKAADSDKLDGKDSTEFSDKVHTHTKSEITDFPTEMPASDVHPWAKEAEKPTYTPVEVGASEASHAHGAITTDGRVGTTPDLPLFTGPNGIVVARTMQEAVQLYQYTNPNILHNWDFRNPVNQRGVSGTLANGIYCIDRWISSSSMKFSNAGMTGSYTSSYLEHRIEGTNLKGATVTASMLLSDGTVLQATTQIPLSGTDEKNFGISTSKVMFGVEDIYIYVRFYTSILLVQAVKLELGTASTLHLDPPMDWAVEMPKCQRFFTKLSEREFIGIFTSTSALRAAIILPTAMRIAPSVGAYSARIHTKTYANGGNPASLVWEPSTSSPNGGAIIATASEPLYGVSAGDPGALTLGGSMYIDLSADL